MMTAWLTYLRKATCSTAFARLPSVSLTTGSGLDIRRHTVLDVADPRVGSEGRILPSSPLFSTSWTTDKPCLIGNVRSYL